MSQRLYGSDLYAANAFAAGLFRGVGVVPAGGGGSGGGAYPEAYYLPPAAFRPPPVPVPAARPVVTRRAAPVFATVDLAVLMAALEEVL